MSSKFSGQFNAFDFAFGNNGSPAPALRVVVANTAVGVGTITAYSSGFNTADGIPIPVTIQCPLKFGVGSNAEVVTPTAIAYTPGDPSTNQALQVEITGTFTKIHGLGDYISSASGGIQEASVAANNYGGGVVLVDVNVSKALGATVAETVTTFDGYESVKLTDISIANGSSYVASADDQPWAVGGGGTVTVTSADITDATTVGKAVLTADTAVDGLAALGVSTTAVLDIARGGTGNNTSTALKANTLATAHTIAISGGAVGTATSFDGSADITIASTLATPTTALRGGVLQQAAIADLTDTPTAANVNSILAALRAAGILASS